MSLVGRAVKVTSGPFQGLSGVVLEDHGRRLVAELVIFGRKTPVPVELIDTDLACLDPPTYRDFAGLLAEFDAAYRQAAPLRYAQLRPGLSPDAFLALQPSLHADVPDQFAALYAWKDGMNTPRGGWLDELGGDGSHLRTPLDDRAHFQPLKRVVQEIAAWEPFAARERERGEPCYWKPGFLPLLSLDSYGLIVVDTVGHWGGQPGQLASFDYKCTNGYRVIAESLGKWLETQLRLLQAGLLFRDGDLAARWAIAREVNGYYTRQFPGELPLE